MVWKLTGDEEVQSKPLMTLGEPEADHTSDFQDSQSAKLHLALGENSPGLEAVRSGVLSGNTQEYKRLLADQEVIQHINSQNDVLDAILQTDPQAVTPDVIDIVRGLSMADIQRPDLADIIEKKYSQIYTNTAAASLDNDILDEAVAADPESSAMMLDRTETVAFKQNYAFSALDTAQKEIESQGLFAKGWNFLENITLNQWQTYDQTGGDFVTSVLPGQNLEQQYAYLWGLQDANEFKTEFDSVVADLRSRNPYTLAQWLQGFFSYGSSDAAMSNIEAGINVASVLPLGKLAQALKGVARGSALNPTRLWKISENLGKYDDAAIGKLVEDVDNKTLFSGDIKNIRELGDSVPSISDPQKLLFGSQNVPKAAYLRMKEALMNRADLVGKFLTDPQAIDRLTPEQLIGYKDILRDDYIREHPSIQKNVIDTEILPEADLGNVYHAKVILGQRDGILFESEAQADNYFKRFIKGTDDYKITQKGQGFQIEIVKPVDETRIYADLKLGTTQRTPESLANAFGGWLRSPNYVLSEEQNLQRSVLTSSKEYLDQVFSEMTKPFKDLSKTELSELQDLLVDNQVSQKYFKNYGEFENEFFNRHHKVPSEKQTDAYFAYVQVNDLDLIVRDLDVYKQKSRLGLREITMKNSAGEDMKFEGKVVDDLPYGSDSPFWVRIVDGKEHKAKFSRYLTDADRQAFQKLKDQGYRFIEVADRNLKIGDDHVGFVLTKGYKSNNLGLLNVNRVEGGHKIHRYPYYIKQGNISQKAEGNFYRGDTTLWNFRSEKEAREFLDVLETARKKLLDNAPDAKKYLRDNIPMPVGRFMKAVVDGDIDLSVPFAVTKSGTRTIDAGAYHELRELKDLTKGDTFMGKIQGRFLGSRDEADVSLVTSEENMKFEIQPAPTLNPLDALSSAASNMLNTKLNDYALSTREVFLKEFGDILEGTKEEQASQGMSVLTNPKFKDGLKGSQLRKVAYAKNVSRAYNNLMNHGTKLDNYVEAWKERLIDTVAPAIKKFGPRGEQWLEDRQLSRIKDPGIYFRSAAFHMKLGMFNVQQYIKQANSLVNVTAIGGANGLRSASLYPIMRYVLFSNERGVLEAGGEIAEKVGLMKSGDFVESMDLLRRSGFELVGNDVSYLDDLRMPEIRETKVGKFTKKTLNVGKTPFVEGERLTRLAAWNTAYLERKALVGAKKLDRRDAAAILLRAKTLIGNMTRESNAPWQKGYLGTMTQFFGYQARIMEQLLGKGLTPAEKAKLFVGYSAVYGVPVAAGATVGVLPIREMTLDYMNAEGYDTNDPTVKVFTDGLVNALGNYVFGKDYNIAGSQGPGGIPTFYDLWRQDKDISDLLMGASGSIISQTAMDSWPALKGMMSVVYDFDGGYYNLTAENMIKPLRNITVVDSAAKLYKVWNVGVWASRNGVDIMKMDLPDAVVAALTGIQPQAIEDSFSKYRASKSYKEHYDQMIKDYTKDLRQILKTEDGDTRDKMIVDFKASVKAEFGDHEATKAMLKIFKYASSNEMMTDVFFEQFEKTRERRGF